MRLLLALLVTIYSCSASTETENDVIVFCEETCGEQPIRNDVENCMEKCLPIVAEYRLSLQNGVDEDDNEVQKRMSSFMRIGKRQSKFLRIGRSPSFVRIGQKSDVEMAPLDTEKRASKFLRIGKKASSFVRIGKILYYEKKIMKF